MPEYDIDERTGEVFWRAGPDDPWAVVASSDEELEAFNAMDEAQKLAVYSRVANPPFITFEGQKQPKSTMPGFHYEYQEGRVQPTGVWNEATQSPGSEYIGAGWQLTADDEVADPKEEDRLTAMSRFGDHYDDAVSQWWNEGGKQTASKGGLGDFIFAAAAVGTKYGIKPDAIYAFLTTNQRATPEMLQTRYTDLMSKLTPETQDILSDHINTIASQAIQADMDDPSGESGKEIWRDVDALLKLGKFTSIDQQIVEQAIRDGADLWEVREKLQGAKQYSSLEQKLANLEPGGVSFQELFKTIREIREFGPNVDIIGKLHQQSIEASKASTRLGENRLIADIAHWVDQLAQGRDDLELKRAALAFESELGHKRLALDEEVLKGQLSLQTELGRGELSLEQYRTQTDLQQQTYENAVSAQQQQYDNQFKASQQDFQNKMDLFDRQAALARSPGDLYVLQQMWRGEKPPTRGPLPPSPAYGMGPTPPSLGGLPPDGITPPTFLPQRIRRTTAQQDAEQNRIAREQGFGLPGAGGVRDQLAAPLTDAELIEQSIAGVGIGIPPELMGIPNGAPTSGIPKGAPTSGIPKGVPTSGTPTSELTKAQEKIINQSAANGQTNGIPKNGAKKNGHISPTEKWPHLEYQYGGTVPGPTGLPQTAVVHGGEEIVPPGSREWAFLKTLKQGGAMGRAKTTFPVMTGIQWPSVQAYQRMMPAEREVLQAKVETYGIPWADWQARRAQSLGLGQQQRRRATMLPTSATMRG